MHIQLPDMTDYRIYYANPDLGNVGFMSEDCQVTFTLTGLNQEVFTAFVSTYPLLPSAVYPKKETENGPA